MLTRHIDHIIIHCSAQPDGGAHTIMDIDAAHKLVGFARKGTYIAKFNRSIKHCGYHAVVHTDGVLATGRHYDEWGAHVKGRNDNSIGVCMVGTDKFTADQWVTLRSFVVGTIRMLADEARLPNKVMTPMDAIIVSKILGVRIEGHRQYSPDIDGNGVIDKTDWLKTCPGFDVSVWLANDMEPLPGDILEKPF